MPDPFDFPAPPPRATPDADIVGGARDVEASIRAEREREQRAASLLRDRISGLLHSLDFNPWEPAPLAYTTMPAEPIDSPEALPKLRYANGPHERCIDWVRALMPHYWLMRRPVENSSGCLDSLGANIPFDPSFSFVPDVQAGDHIGAPHDAPWIYIPDSLYAGRFTLREYFRRCAQSDGPISTHSLSTRVAVISPGYAWENYRTITGFRPGWAARYTLTDGALSDEQHRRVQDFFNHRGRFFPLGQRGPNMINRFVDRTFFTFGLAARSQAELAAARMVQFFERFNGAAVPPEFFSGMARGAERDGVQWRNHPNTRIVHAPSATRAPVGSGAEASPTGGWVFV